MDSMAIYRCQAVSQVLFFAGFLILWISLPTKTTNESDFTVYIIKKLN